MKALHAGTFDLLGPKKCNFVSLVSSKVLMREPIVFLERFYQAREEMSTNLQPQAAHLKSEYFVEYMYVHMCYASCRLYVSMMIWSQSLRIMQ